MKLAFWCTVPYETASEIARAPCVNFEHARSTRHMAMEGESYNWAGASFLTAIVDTLRFYRCLLYFLSGGTFKECPHFNERLQVTQLLKTTPLRASPPSPTNFSTPRK